MTWKSFIQKICDLSGASRSMVTNTKGQLLAAMVAACLVTFLAEITAEKSATVDKPSSNTTQITTNATQNAYIISSVQFEIGVMENETEGSGESGTTAAPVETEKLTETRVAFVLPPASLFNTTLTTAAP